MTWRILQGDCREVLRSLPEALAQTCVTSPPYWGLRDYGVEGQLGLEHTPEEYVAKMVEVFREVRRVLRTDGTLWLNLGDCYAADRKWGGSGDGPQNRNVNIRGRASYPREKKRTGLKPKDLVGIPWRVAFALQADGWWLRSDIVWAKPNPMPESIRDRPTKAHEYVFLFAKSERYFYDADAVREPLVYGDRSGGGPAHQPPGGGPPHTGLRYRSGNKTRTLDHRPGAKEGGRACPFPWEDHGSGRNARSVWTITTKPFAGAHFAVMPWDLAERCLLAGTSERGECPSCGAPWQRIVERVIPTDPGRSADAAHVQHADELSARAASTGKRRLGQAYQDQLDASPPRTTGWRATCSCGGEPRAQMVLDPFAGSGTVGMVARRHGRSFVGIEINPEYAEMARERILGDAPLLNAPPSGAGDDEGREG